MAAQGYNATIHFDVAGLEHIKANFSVYHRKEAFFIGFGHDAELISVRLSELICAARDSAGMPIGRRHSMSSVLGIYKKDVYSNVRRGPWIDGPYSPLEGLLVIPEAGLLFLVTTVVQSTIARGDLADPLDLRRIRLACYFTSHDFTLNKAVVTEALAAELQTWGREIRASNNSTAIQTVFCDWLEERGLLPYALEEWRENIARLIEMENARLKAAVEAAKLAMRRL